jgi:hypothetical protein
MKTKISINSLLTHELSALKPNPQELDKFRGGAELIGPKPWLASDVAHIKSVYRLRAQSGKRKEYSLKIQEPVVIGRQ